MIILVNSKVNASSIQSSLGKPEYSYYFLLKLYRPALEQVGQIIEVGCIDEVDPLFHQYQASGEQVIFLSISPPQQTPVHLQCPTVCLFAWEFPNIPTEAFDNEPRNDWRYVFERIAGAIACSQESAQAVRNVMGEDYPVIALPAPVWAHFQHLCPEQGWLPNQAERSFEFAGNIVDSKDFVFSANGLVQNWPRPQPFVPTKAKATKSNAVSITLTLLKEWLIAVTRSPLIAAITTPIKNAANKTSTFAINRARQARRLAGRVKRAILQPNKLLQKLKAIVNDQAKPEQVMDTSPTQPPMVTLSGVVFTSMFNPMDGRKNWEMIVTAFCWAFRDETNATLVLKITHHELESIRIPLLTLLSRLAPFQCRVIALQGYLDDQQYQQLISMTDFYVNASSSEGLCLPLMEFAAAGKPVMAPIHTAMKDYLSNSFTQLVESSIEPCSLPNDPMAIDSSFRHRIQWQSLMENYRLCHKLALLNPTDYQKQSIHAFNALRGYSDLTSVVTPLSGFLHLASAAKTIRSNV